MAFSESGHVECSSLFLYANAAKTDPEALPSEAKGLLDRPEARNLVNIYSALSEVSVDASDVLA